MYIFKKNIPIYRYPCKSWLVIINWKKNNETMPNLYFQLRQGQSYCTDNECLDELPGLPPASSAGNSFLMMFLMMALAVAMYMMRPRRNQIQDAKPVPNSQVICLIHYITSVLPHTSFIHIYYLCNVLTYISQ